MILNIFKLEAPREKGNCGSKMAGKNIFDFVCFSGREMVVVPPQSQSRRFSRFLSLAGLVFGSHSRYLLTQENRKTEIKVFPHQHSPDIHTLYTRTLVSFLSPFLHKRRRRIREREKNI